MASPVLDPPTMNRLAFISLLYGQGIEQARRPEPLSFVSVLTFHDSVELFLVLAADYLGASLPRRAHGFLDYWQILRRTEAFPAGVDLTGQPAMDRLNRYRNALKHAGAFPGPEAVEDARTSTRSFFENNSAAVFGVAFDAIDIAEVIPQTEARDKVRAATAAETSGDRAEAMALLSEAYDDLFTAASLRPPQSPAAFGATIRTNLTPTTIDSVLRQAPDPRVRRIAGVTTRSLADHIAQLTQAASEMQRGLRVIALGIDYRQAARFVQLTPRILYFADDHVERHFPPGYAPSSAEFDYCRQFIITVALRVAELEAYTALPSWEA
jgi:hypothetical protein